MKKERLYVHPTRIFKTPDDLLDAWCKYKDWTQKEEAKKWLKVQYVGKDAKKVTDKVTIPLSLESFKVWCRVRKEYGCVEQYFKNQDSLYENFIPVCSHIREEIRSQHIIGGMLGAYNPSITQRLHGIGEEKKNDVTIVKVEGVSKEEVDEMLSD